MKILEIYIYGYGQLENVIIKSLSDYQVFYGENEAGKSTLMAFIHGILFGFPTKQSSELRYEPKHSTKYGGKLRIYHEEHGFAVIERVKGKAAGDVKVMMDNGTAGGEELLKQLLGNFDKSLFQAVFSFNLQGLQNIHQMKGEEIGKFLFSAGTLGTEQLAKAENFLQKELDVRFKPSGKKPILNEKLQELHELKGQLKKAAARNNEYEELQRKKEALHQEIDLRNAAIQETDEKINKLKEWKRIESVVKEEIWTEKELKELGTIDFPARGIERLEKINQLIHPVIAEITSITARVEGLQEELTGIGPDLEFLENEPSILTLLDQVPIIEQLTLEKKQSEQKLSDYEEKLSVTREKLHLPLTEDEILMINTNIYMKNQVEMVTQKKQRLEEVKEELDSQYQEEKEALDQLEKEVRFAESKILLQKERIQIEEQISQRNDKQSLEWELKSIQEKIEYYQHENERSQAAKKKLQSDRKLQMFLFASILFGVFLYGLITMQWFLLIVGLAGCIGFVLFWMKGAKQTKEDSILQKIAELKEKEKALQQKLQTSEYLDVKSLENQLLVDNQRRQELQLLKLKLKQQQSLFEKIISKFEDWELATEQNKEKLLFISKELNIPEYIAVSFLAEAFAYIEQYKSICRDKNQFARRINEINHQQSLVEEGLRSIEERFLQEKGHDLHTSAYLLRNKLKEEHEKQIMSKERAKKLEEIKADLAQKVQELELLQIEHHKLLQAAKVDSEQEFYILGEKAKKHEELLERQRSLHNQLQYSLLSEVEKEGFLSIYDCEGLIKQWEFDIQQLQEKLKKDRDEMAAINFEIQVLEEGGVYTDILHQFKQKNYELEEAAKEWSVYRMAQAVLAETIDKYKNVHLPRMLVKAEEYMSILTDGSYNRIHLQKSGTGFLVERDDHTVFEANELSQATTEQLYVSIRLALATTLYDKYQFPIIIDDSFVNFDAKRTQKVIELLRGLKQNQVLFFTCHEHLLAHFQKENVLRLEKGAVQTT
ncbi:AAA family ATPase [Neobacillus drentensis]|uniref:ATP-binding protein n=1 Tax=Neobacillus drentensis TaxID=220684 RepID=UPI001F461A9D|nr:AAA family ATPase [Neobacillus drentensis]ULT58066.1 AAA family ATPase [Neobacillus drentensis]